MKTRMLFILFLCCCAAWGQTSRSWGTYYGQYGLDIINGTATDAAGNVYIAGTTSSDSTIAFNGFQNNMNSFENEAFLAKFDPAGNRLWATYYGGTQRDWGTGVAVDSWGNVYLVGFTQSSGLAFNGYQPTYQGVSDAFLVKFNSLGLRLWATYFGGPSSETATGVTTDNLGNVIISGFTQSTSGISVNGSQSVYGGGWSDLFVAKYDSTGMLSWSTFFGGEGRDYIQGRNVATDPNNNIYITGYTTSLTGIGSGGFQNIHGGGASDVFLVKYNSSGTKLWSTYYGDVSDDQGSGVATDQNGNIYLAGATSSTANISYNGFQNNFIGYPSDAFLVKFDSSGVRLWATYYGGYGTEGLAQNNLLTQVICDHNNNVYLAGSTGSASGIAAGGFQNNHNGNLDAFMVSFDAAGNRRSGTYMGGMFDELVGGIAFYQPNIVYLAGSTYSATNIAGGGYSNTYTNYNDGFLVKMYSGIATNMLDGSLSPMFTITPMANSAGYMIKSSESITEVSLLNVMGQLVNRQTVNENAFLLDMEILPAGMYIINITFANQQSAVVKCINK